MISDFGIDALDRADKAERFAGVAFRIAWIADDEGKLRDDIELADAFCQIQRFLSGDVLFHFLEDPVRAGFGAEENHGAACAADGGERRVGIFIDDVDARFAPPLQVQRRDALASSIAWSSRRKKFMS